MVRDHRTRRRSLGVLATVSLLALAACGDDDEPTTTQAPATQAPTTDAPSTDAPSTDAPSTDAPSTDAPSTDAPSDDPVQAASDLVTALLAGDVEIPEPPGPVTPGEHEVGIIAAGLASTGPATVANAISEAVEVIGWTAEPAWDGQFTPTTQATGISEAVARGVDALFLVAITPSAVSAAVAEAQAAGIPIMCILCGPDPITDGITNIQADATAAGEAQAAYAIANSDGQGTIVLYKNEEFQFSAQQGEAAEAYLTENCPDCTLDVRSVLLLEAREANAPIHTSLLQEYGEGELDFVIHPFDSPSGALSTTASQLGRTDFGVIGYGALSPFVDMIGTGEPAVAKTSVTISSPYYGWVAVDLAARVLAGEDTWQADSMPVGLITQENFGDYEAGAPYLLPDFDFATYFGEIWGR
jgi:ABC-type sugar transport system substrate-binding protein